MHPMFNNNRNDDYVPCPSSPIDPFTGIFLDQTVPCDFDPPAAQALSLEPDHQPFHWPDGGGSAFAPPLTPAFLAPEHVPDLGSAVPGWAQYKSGDPAADALCASFPNNGNSNLLPTMLAGVVPFHPVIPTTCPSLGSTAHYSLPAGQAGSPEGYGMSGPSPPLPPIESLPGYASGAMYHFPSPYGPQPVPLQVHMQAAPLPCMTPQGPAGPMLAIYRWPAQQVEAASPIQHWQYGLAGTPGHALPTDGPQIFPAHGLGVEPYINVPSPCGLLNVHPAQDSREDPWAGPPMPLAASTSVDTPTESSCWNSGDSPSSISPASPYRAHRPLPSPPVAHDVDASPPLSPPSHPDSPDPEPSFKFVTIGDHTYKTSEEYEGGQLVVFYYCDFPKCTKRYRNRASNLRAHLHEKHDITFTRWQCEQCTCSYTRESALRGHMKEHHC